MNIADLRDFISSGSRHPIYETGNNRLGSVSYSCDFGEKYFYAESERDSDEDAN